MDKINDILIKIFKISRDQSEKNLGMKDITAWDSLSHMDLITRVEDEFKIQLSGDEIAEMTTFDSIRNIIKKHVPKL